MLSPFRTLLRRLPVALALSLGLAATAPAQGDIPIYGAKKFGPAFYTIDTSTGQATLATSDLAVTMVSIARNPVNGLIYDVGNVDPQAVVTWDPTTNIETIINPSTNKQLHRLGSNRLGEIYGVPLNSRRMFQVDTDSGVMTSVGDITGVPTAGSTGDLAFHPEAEDWFHYLAGRTLYRVTLDPLAGTEVGHTGIDAEGVGLAYDPDGRLFACTAWNLYELDPLTGAGTFIGPIGQKMNDLSSAIPARPLILNVPDRDVNTGDPLTFEGIGGDPGNLLGLVVVGLDGLPIYRIVLIDVFDASGEWGMTVPAPPGPAGMDLTFRLVGIASDGELHESNDRVVTFR